ncbi:MAG TPA: tetratricopeptide repeat protein [Kofleriaceae bacterium]|nr:tetratricopeptide repeat protein [Kofleriaceae bacterium]
MGCLDADTLAALFAGELSAAEREQAEAHADECASCRSCIAALARGQAAPAGEVGDGAIADETASPELAGRPRGGGPGALEPGRAVSRYLVREFLGAGAMGAVYAAHDPQLDRTVALKIVGGLVTDAADGGGEMRARRLVREAQAMARLSHPNVIPVYDAGQDGDLVFIAMKRVDGVPLGRWLDQAGAGQREVLRVLCDAGRGLAAAHAAGIVHRDFKPDNVLVDRRGVAQVGDFGLAMVEDDRAGEASQAAAATAAVAGPGSTAAAALTAPASTPSTGSTWRTADGAILGTPAYLAPEVWRGARADARSDQYSFAVTLHEALTGKRPGRASLAAGEPLSSRLPRRLQRLLGRALADEPAARFASMADLVAALEPRRAARGALLVAGGGGLIAIAAAVWLGAGAGAAPDPGAACDQAAAARLAEVWSSPRRAAAAAHLASLPGPDASRAAAAALARVDRYAGDWQAMRRAACRATRSTGEQSAELLDLRMRCLDERLDEVEVVRGSLARLTADQVGNAARLADVLGDLVQCDDPRGLRSRAASITGPAAVERARALRARLAEARALLPRGDFDEAEKRTDAIVADARAARLPIVEAEALLTRSQVRGVARKEGVADGFHQALAIAERLGDAATRVDALIGLLADATADPARASEIELLARLVDSGLAELPGDQSARRGRAAGNLANYYEYKQDFPAAEAKMGEAHRSFRALYGPGNGWTLMAREGQARLLSTQGRHGAAVAIMAEVLGTTRAVYGDDHPLVGKALLGQGVFHAHAQDRDAARDCFQRALAVFEKAQGPDHPMVAEALRKIGYLALDDDPAAARAAFARAIAIFEKTSGSKNPELAPLLAGLGEAELLTGDAAAAVTTLERSLAVWGESKVAAHLIPNTRYALARAVWQSGGDRRRARALAEQAREEYLANRGPWLPKADEVAAWLKAHR